MNLKPLLVGISLLASSSLYAANAPVNIVYPIDGNSYSNYFNLSFSTTCPGGAYSVKWGIDSSTLGSGSFYDQQSTQLAYKQSSGWHSFWVKTSCGYDIVKFYVN